MACWGLAGVSQRMRSRKTPRGVGCNHRVQRGPCSDESLAPRIGIVVCPPPQRAHRHSHRYRGYVGFIRGITRPIGVEPERGRAGSRKRDVTLVVGGALWAGAAFRCETTLGRPAGSAGHPVPHAGSARPPVVHRRAKCSASRARARLGGRPGNPLARGASRRCLDLRADARRLDLRGRRPRARFGAPSRLVSASRIGGRRRGSHFGWHRFGGQRGRGELDFRSRPALGLARLCDRDDRPLHRIGPGRGRVEFRRARPARK